MTITQEEYGFISKGLDLIEARYLNDYHAYKEQGNEEAAKDCLAYYKRVYHLHTNIKAERQYGTDIAFEIVSI